MSLESPEFLLLTRKLKSELLWITIYFSFFNVFFESIYPNPESLNYVTKMEIQNFKLDQVMFQYYATSKPNMHATIPL